MGEDRAEGERSSALEINVTRLLRPDHDVTALEAITRESFDGPSFSPVDELGRAWARVWIARQGGTEGAPPLGFLVAWHVADELHVLNVATALAARRRGVGAALVNEAIRYAAESGVRLLLLEVRRSNRPAIGLYRKLAFCTSGLRKDYYPDGEDAIEMQLVLDPATGQVMAGEDEVVIDA